MPSETFPSWPDSVVEWQHGNVALGVDQHAARQTDNPLILPATGGWRQFAFSLISHVYADDGEVAVFEFPNVRASFAARAFRAVSVRVKADPALEREFSLHAATFRQCREKRKCKIPAIAGLVFHPLSDSLCIVAKPTAIRKSLGQAIRNHRKNANLTQELLGERADLNPKYIGEVERMEKTISVDALGRIAKALKVRVRDLLADV